MERVDLYKLRRVLGKRSNFLAMGIALVVMLIFYPVDGKFRYQYKKGSPWLYETLVSPIDFPLLKTQQELAEEKSRAAESMIQYFRTDEGVKNSVLTDFSGKCLSDSISPAIRDAVSESLAKIYNMGVLPERTLTDKTVFIQRGRNALPEIEMDLYTPSKALKLVRSDLKYALPLVNPDSLMDALDIASLLVPNLTFDKTTTEELHHRAADYISPTKGMVYAGEHIVTEGETVTAEIAQILDSFKAEYQKSVGYSGNLLLIHLGHALIIIMLLIMAYIAVYFSDPDVLRHQNEFNFVVFILCLNFVVMMLVRKISPEFLYLVPFAVTVLYMSSFLYNRVVLPVYLVSIIPLLFIAENGVELFTIAGAAGCIAFVSFSLYERGWLQFMNCFYIFFACAIVHIGFKLIADGTIFPLESKIYLYLFIASILVVITYPFVFIMEKMFYMVSISTLKDLSDTENDILEELSAKAPGTFQHSLQVANLAERAVVAIGGNPRIARAGALYHDIGKMSNPQAFIENNPAGSDLHKDLSPVESAQLIIKHVEDGVAIAQKHKLPQVIQDFILSHHGHSVTEYFYNVYCNNGGDPADKTMFTYKGNLPVSKEEVVVMIADAVEAASRSLKEYSEESIAALVDSVVAKRISGNQLIRSDVTFRNLNTIKAVMKRQIREIYHVRIAYPKRNA
ncbi:MAG: HDIG domain-containing protein [Bacteroidales bacterium]|nr:HDIG domain-containing protein [Bacteroidales bacterium]